MISIPLYESCIAIGGRTNKDVSPIKYVHHVTQKSGDVREGSLFVAYKGNNVDGHDFVMEAEKSGAVAAVVEREMPNISIPQFIVPSSKKALGDLGKIWKGRLNIPTIAVTGSVGKTTTKDIITHVLEAKFRTHKSRENFNNEFGVPIELMRLDEKHQCSVVEFGMRDLDQINYLANIARPTIGVITNIGMSHIEILKTRENIAIAKAEILEGMDSGSTLILNRDDDFYNFIKNKAHCKVISFGEHKESEIRITDIQLNQKGSPSFKLNGTSISMDRCTGQHQAYNGAIAYAIGIELGLTKEVIVKRLSTFNTSKKRGEMKKSKNGAIILDSSYNAAPDSIKSSIYTIAELGRRDKKTIAVIGDMLELGAHSQEAHRHIGSVVSELENLELLVTVGKYAEFIGKEANLKKWSHFKNSKDAAKFLLPYVNSEHVILVQGSNGISLNIVVDSLESGELT